MFNKKLQKFSIRKLTIGAASVLIGVSFIAMNNNNEVKADTVQVVQTQQTIPEAKQDVAQKQNELDQAQSNLSAGQKQNADIDQAKKDVQNDPKKIADTTKQIANSNQQLKEESDKTQGLTDTAKNAQDALQTAKDDQAEKQTTTDQAKQNLDQKTENAQGAVKAKDDLDAAKKAQSDNDQSKQTDKNNIAQDAVDYNKVVNDLNKATDDKAAKQTALDNANTALQAATQDKTVLENKLQQAKDALKQKQAALDAAKKLQDDKKAEIAQNNTALDTANNAKADATTEYNKYDAQVAQLTKELNDAKSDLASINQQINDNKAKIAQLQSQTQALTAALQTATDNYNQAKVAYTDSMIDDENKLVIPQSWVDDVNQLQKIYDDAQAQNQKDIQEHGHWVTLPDGSEMIKMDPGNYPTRNQDWLEANDPDFINLRHKMYVEGLSLQKITINPNDKDKMIDINNLSATDDLDLNLFAIKMINSAREALGKKLLTLNQSAIDMAREIGKEYNADGRTNPDDLGHDPRAINKVSQEWGIHNWGDLIDTTTIDPANPGVEVHDYQAIENLGAMGAGQVEWTIKTDPKSNEPYFSAKNNYPYDVQVEKQQGITHMENAKQWVWWSVVDMIFNNDELGHMRSLTSTLEDSDDNDNQNIYFGLGLNAPKGEDGSVHLLIIPSAFVGHKDYYGPDDPTDNYYKDKNEGSYQNNIPTKFDKTANIEIPDTAKLNTALSAANDAKTTALNNLDKNAQDIKDAQATQVQLEKQPARDADVINNNPGLIETAKHNRTNAQNDISSAQQTIDQLTQTAQTLQDQLNALTDNVKVATTARDDTQAAETTAQNKADAATDTYNAAVNDQQSKQNAYNKASDKVTSLKSQKQAISQKQEKDQASLASHESQDAKLAQDVADKQAIADQFAAKIAEIKVAQDAYDVAKAISDKAANHTADLQKVSDDANKALATNKAKIVELQRDIDAKTKILAQTKANLEAAKKTAAMTPANLADLQAKVVSAQSALDAAKANLTKLEQAEAEAEAQANAQKTTTDETLMSGIAYVPVINNNANYKVALRNSKGQMTGEYIKTNSGWKVFAKKTVNGIEMYRLGTEDQWIPAQYVTLKNITVNDETPMGGTVYVPVINGNKNYKVALRDSNGHVTGKYISTDSNWKVLAKKTVNGVVMYRLGNEDQWVPAQYVSTSAETPVNIVVYLPVINNNRNWKVALRNSDGQMTGKYIATNSNWKALAKKTVNGQVMYRLGTQDQWVPAKYTDYNYNL